MLSQPLIANTHFPLIVILDCPYIHAKKRSYGIILRAKSTNRYLMTTRKDSNAYVCLSRGTYHTSRIVNYLSYLQEDQLRMLLEVSRDINLFKSFCKDVEGSVNAATIDYSFKKIVRIRWVIEKLANSTTSSTPYEPSENYVWPKGKSNFGENPFQTALREMKEETGVSLDRIGFEMMKDAVTCEMYTLCNTKYVNTYYCCCIDKEVKAYPCDLDEVAACAWICKKKVLQCGVDCCNALP